MAENDFPKSDGEILYGSEANYQTGNMVTAEAGQTIAAGEICYVHLTDGKVYVSDTGTADEIRANGIAQSAASSGADVTLQTSGVWITTGLTDKEDYYLGAAGALSTTKSGVRIGTANGTTELYIKIVQDDGDTLGTIKAWHKDMTGMIANPLTAFWVECNGQTLSDTESSFNTQTIPDLNTGNVEENYSYFLRGHSASGLTETSQNKAHTHDFAYSAGSTGSTAPETADPDSGNLTTASSGGTEARPMAFTVVWIMKIK